MSGNNPICWLSFHKWRRLSGQREPEIDQVYACDRCQKTGRLAEFVNIADFGEDQAATRILADGEHVSPMFKKVILAVVIMWIFVLFVLLAKVLP